MTHRAPDDPTDIGVPPAPPVGELPPIPTAAKAWVAFVIGLLLVVATTSATVLLDGWQPQDAWLIGIAVLSWLGTTFGVYQTPYFKQR